MDFEFSDEQEQLRDAVRRWVDKGFGFERRHALAKAGGQSREVLGEINDLGLAGLVVPEAHGGMGFGAIEAMVVMEELGRGLVNAPYTQAALVAPTLLSYASAELQQAWLPKIAGGEALVVLAQQERHSRYDLDKVAVKAAEAGGAWKLSGTKVVVPAGDEADAFIVSARVSGGESDPAGVALFIVDKAAAGLTVRGYPTQDGARAADVVLAGTPATLLTRKGHDALAHAADVAIAALCAEAVGLMDRMLAVTVDYMHQRKQFGVPLATFQALRHRIADVKMQVELGRSMSYFASLKLGEAPDARRRALSQAKVQLGHSMRFVGQQCTQIHGGIGVTDEYVSSHYFKRLTVIELSFGDTMYHLGEVSARMRDSAGVFA
ncbi:MAG: acyl-CoA dehydrogenase family protein [Rubrivivax sp.]|nr:acyl-CoA dehydrogenase family protein [Rubrivivax sp.]